MHCTTVLYCCCRVQYSSIMRASHFASALGSLLYIASMRACHTRRGRRVGVKPRRCLHSTCGDMSVKRHTILRDPSMHQGLPGENLLSRDCCTGALLAVRQFTLSARRLEVGLWYFICSAATSFFFFGRSLGAPSPPVLVASPCGRRRPPPACGARTSLSWFRDIYLLLFPTEFSLVLVLLLSFRAEQAVSSCALR